MMKPGTRKLALTVHLTASVGWIGGVIVYLALGVAAATDTNPETIRSAWLAMELIGWNVLIPLALASLLTGLLMSLGTKWGLFRHYWVAISFVLTAFSNVVLILHMPGVSETADRARAADAVELQGLGGDLLHPGVGLLILIGVQVLNIYKPTGLTRYGWRKQNVTYRVSSVQSPGSSAG